MPYLSRAQFVAICTQAILNTKATVVAENQLSGYKKYHAETKENKYLDSLVRPRALSTLPEDYIYRHDLIEHFGLGRCHELADFLLVEIARDINAMSAVARIQMVFSARYDHTYLEVKIHLEGERSSSLWEVDAWDPRIIDISERPDGTIKNHEALDYGYSAGIEHTVSTDQINYHRRYHFFGVIPKPIPGRATRGATPDREMLEQHLWLYDDYTIEEAVAEGKIDPSGSLGYLQRVSSWQRY